MSRLRIMAALVWALAVVALTVHAESPVNFSGTWELDRSRSTLPSEVPSAGDLKLVISHQGDKLAIERHVHGMGMSRKSMALYYTDGREAPNKTPRGDTAVSRSHWDGNTLVTVTKGTKKTSRSGQVEEVTETKKLAEGGKVLIIDASIRRAGQDTPTEVHSVFVKQ